MAIQFYHDGTPSAALAVWMYIVPNEKVQCPLLLGRDSWIRFYSHSYQTLPPQPDGRVFGELPLLQICDDAHSSVATSIRKCEASDVAYRLVYDGVYFGRASQLFLVNMIRLDRSPALTDHYMVDIIPAYDGLDPSERFVSSGRQTVLLTGYQDLEPGDILGTASSPFLRVPLEALIGRTRGEKTPSGRGSQCRVVRGGERGRAAVAAIAGVVHTRGHLPFISMVTSGSSGGASRSLCP